MTMKILWIVIDVNILLLVKVEFEYVFVFIKHLSFYTAIRALKILSLSLSIFIYLSLRRQHSVLLIVWRPMNVCRRLWSKHPTWISWLCILWQRTHGTCLSVWPQTHKGRHAGTHTATLGFKRCLQGRWSVTSSACPLKLVCLNVFTSAQLSGAQGSENWP